MVGGWGRGSNGNVYIRREGVRVDEWLLYWMALLEFPSLFPTALHELDTPPSPVYLLSFVNLAN